MLVYVFTLGHMYWFDTELYPTKVSWHLYTLFMIDSEQIKINSNCDVKEQTHKVTYNLNRYLWAISALATKNDAYYIYRKPIALISVPSSISILV